VTGLRRGELFGLKWEDVDFVEAEIRVVRSVVDQVEGPPKSLASRRPIPMSSEPASALANWRKQTNFPNPGDWVFASPQALGKRPYWPDAVLKRHVLPAAERAGITKKIGWHSFRRTLATLLQSSGASVKTTQELLRHSSPVLTLGPTPRQSQRTNAKRKTPSPRYSLAAPTRAQRRPMRQRLKPGTECSFLFLNLFPAALTEKPKLLKVNGRDD
jgi:integrase